MRRLARALALGSLAVAAVVAAPAPAAPRAPALRGVHSWAFALGSDLGPRDVARLSRVDLAVVDGEAVSAPVVRTLHRRGVVVLAYLSVGTIETGRPWYATLAPYRLDYWPEWGEWYADASAAGFRRAIAAGIAPRILATGADGLFLDNTDMIETHRRQAAGMRSLVASLGRLVHRRGGLLFAQNGEAVIGPMLRHLDGWNREDVTFTHDGSYVRVPAADHAAALAALRRMRRAGLLTTATDYVAAGDAAAAREGARAACAVGALPYASDIGLTRIPAAPRRCP